MEDLLQHLEKRIKELIDQHTSLKCSNLRLHQSNHVLIREKDVLATKQQKAIVQIESLIARLKALEKSS